MPASLRRALVALTVAVSTAAPAAAEPRPGCYTEETVRRFLQDAPDETCAFVRPGIHVDVVKDGDRRTCQTSYLFTGSNGARYLGTDGYCVLANADCAEYVLDILPLCLAAEDPSTDGPKVFPKGHGYPVFLRDGRRIGEVRYAVYETGSEFSNFALVQLDPKVPASPSIRGWGGPTGVDRRVTTEREDVLLTSTFAQNEAVATRGFYAVRAFSGVLPEPAISLGGAVLTADGKAVGIVSTADVGSYVERLDPLLRRAGSRLKVRITVATAPFTGG